MIRHAGFVKALVLTTTVGFLFTEFLQGLLRHLVGDSSLVAVLYMPKAAMVALIALQLAVGRTVAVTSLPFAGALLTWIGIGFVVIGNSIQIAFGIWLLTPLIFGFVFGDLLLMEVHRKLCSWLLALWSLAVAGLVFNYFNDLPWAGAELNVLGHDVEAQREWTTQGISRLSGFSRASYFVAAQILLLALLLVPSLRTRTARAAIWLATGTAVVVTTSKGPSAAWLICSIYFISTSLSLRRAAAAMPMVIAVITCTLPLMFISGDDFIDFAWLGLDDATLNLLLNSMIERFTSGWPVAFQYISDRGLYLSGTGIGGNGTAMKLFDGNVYIPGDNIMVAMYICFGVWTIVPLAWFICRISPFRQLRASIIYPFQLPLTLALSVIGLTAYLFEDPVMSILLGALIRTLSKRRERDIPVSVPSKHHAATAA